MEDAKGRPKKKVLTHCDLEVYERAYKASMEIYGHAKHFPKEERYSLTDQVLRSSRAVCANLAEAWRRRRYPHSFVNRISLAEAEAAETQVWLQYAVDCGYLAADPARELYRAYSAIIATLVGMITHADTWTIQPPALKGPSPPPDNDDERPA